MHELCLAVFCLAVPSLAQEPIKPVAKAESLTRFGWPVPCDVAVVEKATKRGNVATMSYTIQLRKDPDHEGEIRMSHADFKFLTINGKKADAMPVGVVEVLARTRPDVRVDAKGKAVAVMDINRTIEAGIAVFEKLGAETKGGLPIAQLRQLLKSPSMRRAMEASTKQEWSSWVGDWVGVARTAAGKTVEGPSELSWAGPKRIVGNKQIKNNGDAKGFPGHIDLTMETKYGGEAVIAWLTEQARQAMPPAVRAQMPKVLLESASLVQHARALIRPDTLQPLRVLTEHVTTIKPIGKPEVKQVERHQYEFHWKKSDSGK